MIRQAMTYGVECLANYETSHAKNERSRDQNVEMDMW